MGISIGIVFLFIKLGKQGTGPIENVMSELSGTISKFEDDLIIGQRGVRRAERLAWLEEYKQNPSLIKSPERILLGAFDNQVITSFQPIINLEDSLNATFPIFHIYTAWGSKRTQQFPIEQIRAIATLGSIPLITWEPWLNDFSEEYLTPEEAQQDPNKGGLKDIAAGKFDSYLQTWAEEAKQSGVTMMIRLGHEMNDPYRYPWGPQNNSPEDFVSAWKHVVDLFRNQGAENVIWVWSPHLAYGFFDEYYPGEEYVDWVATGTLNYGTVASWSQWWTFDEIFGNYYDAIATFGKPILLAEFGSLAVGGDREKWYADALDSLPERYPLVKSLVFFHHKSDATTTYQPLDWSISNDTVLLKTVGEKIDSWENKE